MKKYTFVLLFIVSCNQTAESNVNIDEMIKIMLKSENINIYTKNFCNDKYPIYYRFEQLPICDSKMIVIKRLKKIKINNCDFYFDDNYKGELEKITIIFQSFIVDQNSAVVKIRIPKQGVIGDFNLIFDKKWIIKNSNIYEI